MEGLHPDFHRFRFDPRLDGLPKGLHGPGVIEIDIYFLAARKEGNLGGLKGWLGENRSRS